MMCRDARSRTSSSSSASFFQRKCLIISHDKQTSEHASATTCDNTVKCAGDKSFLRPPYVRSADYFHLSLIHI
eukprot:6333488-Amphidinium_carterae.2